MCKAEDIKIDEEFVVNYTDLGKQNTIVDSGSLVSLARKEWLVQYLKEFNLEIGEMKSVSCRHAFRFGFGKRFVREEMIEVPIVVEKIDGLEEVLKVQTYMVEVKVPFLLGKRTLKLWNSKVDMKNNVLETCIDGRTMNLRMTETSAKTIH